MERSHWDRIQTLFHRAAELPASEQRSFLASEANGNADVIETVTAMLQQDRENALRNTSVEELLEEALQVTREEIPLHKLGPYTIERVLGEGGMGVVYLADRPDLGPVAIKVLRSQGLSPGLRDQFAVEKRLLARLNHASIAKIYDADTLLGETPWFAMEYVDGMPLTEYCRSHELSIQQRLLLFRSVCEAVQYAHGHAIIHRDLKPSNIFVTHEGNVKLLDFGIAEQLGKDGKPLSSPGTDVQPMTLAYAAPEQLNNELVGIQTDIYALGVILYELVAGRLPFDLSTATSIEANKMIKAGDPESPSAVTGQLDASSNSAKVRSALTKTEWSDLDTLCLTAMNKVPDLRYASVDALIRDLDHYLNQEPLQARLDKTVENRLHKWIYTSKKFAVRNRNPIFVASAIFLAIVGLIGYYTLRLSRARDAAVTEAARSQLIERFLFQLMGTDDQEAGPNEDLRVSTVLKRGEQQAAALNGDPSLQADLSEALGNTYRRLGKLDRADALLNTALQARKRLFGNQGHEVAKILTDLGLVQSDLAHYDTAERLARGGLLMEQRASPHNDAQVANALTVLGQVLVQRGSLKPAIDVLNQAVLLQAGAKAQLADQSDTLNVLAVAHIDAGDYQISDSLDRRLLTIDKQLYSEAHPRFAFDLMNLGTSLMARGYYAEAEKYYRSGLAANLTWYGTDHPQTAMDMMMLGQVLIREGKLAEAAELLRRSLDIQDHISKAPTPNRAFVLDSLGNVALKRGLLGEAQNYYDRALDMNRSLFGDESFRVGIEVANLADLYSAKKDYPHAEALYRGAFQRFTAAFPPGNINIGAVQVKLGHTLVLERRFRDAEPFLLRGYEILTKQTSPSVKWLQDARRDLVAVYDFTKDSEKAQKFRSEISSETASAIATTH